MATTTNIDGYQDTDVPALSLKPGDRVRDFGRGYIAHTVVSVERSCNCKMSARSIDPVTRESLHYPVILIKYEHDRGRILGYLGHDPTEDTVVLTSPDALL